LELLFLLGGEVLPCLHPSQDLLLPVGRHAVKALQALFILLLTFAR
jgi:hypothetical protein